LTNDATELDAAGLRVHVSRVVMPKSNHRQAPPGQKPPPTGPSAPTNPNSNPNLNPNPGEVLSIVVVRGEGFVRTPPKSGAVRDGDPA